MTAEVLSLSRGGAAGPAPLVPAGVDVRDAPDFRFNIARMLDSDWYHSCSTREALAGINLHARAIHQVPAGSLPSADALLARLADFGRDVDGWREVKAKALEGWVLCSDGRFYHPEVARNALHIWIGRLQKRRNSATANLAQAPDRDFGLDEIAAAFDEACEALRAIDPQDGMLREAMKKATRSKAKRTALGPVPDAASADVDDPSRAPSRTPTRTPSRGPLDGPPKRSEAKPSESIPFGRSPNGTREDATSVSAREIEKNCDSPSHPDGDAPGVPVVEAYPPSAFQRFWETWPNKVGLGAAERAFAKIQKSGQVGFATLMAALERYKRCKPVDRPWCNPATWLNQKRWLDEWPTEVCRPVGDRTPSGHPGSEPSITHRAAMLAAERLGLLDEPRPRG